MRLSIFFQSKRATKKYGVKLDFLGINVSELNLKQKLISFRKVYVVNIILLA